jgi:hypothetical protein
MQTQVIAILYLWFSWFYLNLKLYENAGKIGNSDTALKTLLGPLSALVL